MDKVQQRQTEVKQMSVGSTRTRLLHPDNAGATASSGGRRAAGVKTHPLKTSSWLSNHVLGIPFHRKPRRSRSSLPAQVVPMKKLTELVYWSVELSWTLTCFLRWLLCLLVGRAREDNEALTSCWKPCYCFCPGIVPPSLRRRRWMWNFCGGGLRAQPNICWI